MGSKKEMEEAAKKAVETGTQALTGVMAEAVKDRIEVSTGPLKHLNALASEYQTVNVFIHKVSEKTGAKSLFTELQGTPIVDALASDPEALCKREGGGGLWQITYRTPDNKGRPVVIPNIRTEGRPQMIATHEANDQGLDPYTGTPKLGGGLPATTVAGGFGGNSADVIKSVQQAAESTASRERQHMSDMFGAMSKSTEMLMLALLGNKSHDQSSPQQSEELRIMRDQNQRLMDEMRSLREEQRKSEGERQIGALQLQIQSMQDRMIEAQKSTELKMLEAKLAEVSKPQPVDPAVNLLTTVLGATREDAKSNNALMLELFSKLSDKPDSTDKFAKVQNLLLESAMGQFQLMQQIAQTQGGSSSPLVEIFRTIAQTASSYFGSQGEVEEEELGEVEDVRQLAGVSERQLTVAPDPEPEGDQHEAETTQEGAKEVEISAEQMKEDIQGQIERWEAGEAIPEKDEQGKTILFTEKELDKVLATSSLDTAIRLLVSRKKPIPEVTARIYALVEGGHPLAIHWLTHPLPATWQILRHWDQRNGSTEASKRMVDLVIDMIMIWAWINQGNDPYGRSNYRPSRAVAGVESHTHGVTTQGKPMQSQFGTKQGEEVTEEGEGS